MQGIYNSVPETSHVSMVQCLSYSVIIIRGAYNAVSKVKSLLL